jgi:hypothetical protein
MRKLPESYPEVEQADPRHCAAHPARRDSMLQALQTRLLCRVKKEVVVAPIAQSERVNPRQQCEHNADFEAQDDVEDNC